MTDYDDGVEDEQAQREEIQVTVGEVLRNNKWATRIEITLIAVMVAAVSVSAVFDVMAISRAEGQREDLEMLTEVIQDYNEAHAQSTAASHLALADALACSFALYLRYPNITETEIGTCYRPTAPAPPRPPDPVNPNNKDGPKE